jgi:hypothetical protein
VRILMRPPRIRVATSTSGAIPWRYGSEEAVLPAVPFVGSGALVDPTNGVDLLSDLCAASTSGRKFLARTILSQWLTSVS